MAMSPNRPIEYGSKLSGTTGSDLPAGYRMPKVFAKT